MRGAVVRPAVVIATVAIVAACVAPTETVRVSESDLPLILAQPQWSVSDARAAQFDSSMRFTAFFGLELDPGETRVVRETDDWPRFLARGPHGEPLDYPMPTIDFTREMVVLAAVNDVSGEFRRTRIRHVAVWNGALVVVTTRIRWAQECLIDEATIDARERVGFRVIPATDLPVRFLSMPETRECGPRIPDTDTGPGRESPSETTGTEPPTPRSPLPPATP